MRQGREGRSVRARWRQRKTNTRRLREEDLDLTMLRLIHCQPGISLCDLARLLVSSDRRLERWLRSLSDQGLLRIDRRASRVGRQLRVLRLTPEGETAKASLTRIIIARKLVECEALEDEIEELQKTVSENPG